MSNTHKHKQKTRNPLRYLLSSSFAFALVFSIALTGQAQTAQQSQSDDVKRAAQGMLSPKFKIESVQYVKELNMYRIAVNGGYMHMTQDMRYAFIGDVVDVKKGKSIINSPGNIAFEKLPLGDAIKRGNGKLKVALFIDMKCGYCHKLYTELSKEKDITMYVFLVPFMGAESKTMAEQIWLADNPAAALDDVIIDSKQVQTQKTGDVSFLERNYKLAKSLNIRSTPTLFFTDGSSSIGYQQVDKLRTRIIASSKGNN